MSDYLFSSDLNFRVRRLFVNGKEVKCYRFTLFNRDGLVNFNLFGGFDRAKIWLDEDVVVEFDIERLVFKVVRDSYEEELWIESVGDVML